MVDVNVNGLLHGVAAVLPTFIAQKSGHVTATSSVVGLKGYPGGAFMGLINAYAVPPVPAPSP